MNRKTYRHFNVIEQCFTHMWALEVSEDFVITFHVRMPTSNWHYYLPMGINLHKTKPTYDDMTGLDGCSVLGGKTCYCDGSSLAGQELWNKYMKTGDEEIIWKELELWIR